jgi:galactokinase
MITAKTKLQEVQEQFDTLFGQWPRVYRAPGRVNLIGEHTDYNEGWVMPVAIQFHVWVAATARNDHKLLAHSTNFSETIEIDLQSQELRPRNHWSDYVLGVAMVLEQSGHVLRGANLLILGDVPIGSGLSSSAALEIASGFALLTTAGIPVDRTELAKLCQRAGNEIVGARVGIMDPFISCFGCSGRALMLDCRTPQYCLLPVSSEAQLVICNTTVKHSLANGEYNSRRAECEEAVRVLSHFLPYVRALRDVTLADLAHYARELRPSVYKRSRHVSSENMRVTEAADALRKNDLPKFGHLMGESHCSLKEDYEVSCAELDLMVELAQKQPGVYGSRMTGGGFGGCTINVVDGQAVDNFQRNIFRDYQRLTGRTPQIFVSTLADGACEVESA